MPKKKPGMTPEEQSEKFRREAEKLIADGSLDPTEAEKRFDAFVAGALRPKRKSPPN